MVHVCAGTSMMFEGYWWSFRANRRCFLTDTKSLYHLGNSMGKAFIKDTVAMQLELWQMHAPAHLNIALLHMLSTECFALAPSILLASQWQNRGIPGQEPYWNYVSGSEAWMYLQIGCYARIAHLARPLGPGRSPALQPHPSRMHWQVGPIPSYICR